MGSPTPLVPSQNVPWIITTPDSGAPAFSAPNNHANQWLVIMGCLYLGFTIIQWLVDQCLDLPGWSGICAMLHIAWCVAWICYGGYVLFKDAGPICHHSAYSHAHLVFSTGVAMWVLMIVGLPFLVILCIAYWLS